MGIMNMKAITILSVFLGFAAPGVFAKKWKNGVADPLCYQAQKSCDNTQQDELAILVTGGEFTETSSEVLFTNGSSICELPPMSQSKSFHTQSGLTACGGSDNGSGSGTERSCIKFEAGSWTTLTDNLVEERSVHSSWINPDGDILLIGGNLSYNTTEIVYQDG